MTDETNEAAVRKVVAADLAALVALNNEHAAEIGLTDSDAFARLVELAAFAAAIGPHGDPYAFVLTFSESTPRQGPNHGWFLERHARFLYVDRVCVGRAWRRRGFARKLYAAVFSQALQRGAPVVCCEVNLDPPNPGSDAFHAAFGFAEAGTALLRDRGKTVRYLERSVVRPM